MNNRQPTRFFSISFQTKGDRNLAATFKGGNGTLQIGHSIKVIALVVGGSNVEAELLLTLAHPCKSSQLEELIRKRSSSVSDEVIPHATIEDHLSYYRPI